MTGCEIKKQLEVNQLPGGVVFVIFIGVNIRSTTIYSIYHPAEDVKKNIYFL